MKMKQRTNTKMLRIIIKKEAKRSRATTFAITKLEKRNKEKFNILFAIFVKINNLFRTQKLFHIFDVLILFTLTVEHFLVFLVQLEVFEVRLSSAGIRGFLTNIGYKN